MQTGIIGLPQVGKTTLFKILTRAHLDEKAARAAVEAQQPSLMEKIGSGLFDILKTALVSTLSGAVAGKVAENDDKQGNGQNGGTGGAY